MSDNFQARGSDDSSFDTPLYTPIKRRSFFLYAGATAGATALVLAGCKDDTVESEPFSYVNVGSGDAGVLNYAYALEQIEAEFYRQVREGDFYKKVPVMVNGAPSPLITDAEKQILDEIYYHEVIHRDFLKAAITAAGLTPIRDLDFNMSSLDFRTKGGVLGTARTFEDLGVAAYNGAAKFFTNPTYLAIAGKIVSVEARHAAIIRDLNTEGSFVNTEVVVTANSTQMNTFQPVPPSTTTTTVTSIINATGLERSRTPQSVVDVVNLYLKLGSKLVTTGLR